MRPTATVCRPRSSFTQATPAGTVQASSNIDLWTVMMRGLDQHRCWV